MHKLQMYEGLRDMLEKEVTEIEKKGNLDPQGLDNLYKLMTALKVTDKCIEREGGESYESRRSYGRSNARNRSYDGSYDSYESMDMRMMPWAYEDGMSNARRGRSRDESYEESRDNFRGNSNRRGSNESRRSYEYSRDNARKKMVQKLETLMDDTMSDFERQAIMDCIDKIQ